MDEPCPLDGKCFTAKVVYKATVKEDDNTTNTYTGVTKNSEIYSTCSAGTDVTNYSAIFERRFF